jgi:hypothetical protein
VNQDPRRYSAPVFDLQAYREQLDNDREDFCEVPISRRARWLGYAEDTVLSLLFVGSIVALCAAVMLSPLIAVAAWLRSWVTP